jgi:hypothetical protein
MPGVADELDAIARSYERFAEHEATGRSPLYVELALGVARDREVLGFLAGLPAPKRQPNLVFGAVRMLCGTPAGPDEMRTAVLERGDEITALLLARRTQTNEPARCATLLPLLALLPQPLALLEVGASAGLCLIPERYGYDYGRARIEPPGPGAPVFACRASPSTPLPERVPEIVWRAGLDIAPVDLTNPEDVAWLEALVWPGEGRRLELLRAAINVALSDPPRVVRGDLRRDLPALAADAPPDATLVVFHTAVLAYIHDADERAAFGETVRGLGATWIANEGAGLVAGAAQDEPWPTGGFVLTRDAVPVALTDPHGTAIDWLG